MVTGKTALLRAQRRWADVRGVRYDARGCVRELADNLRVPLAGPALDDVRRGSELTPSASGPARIYSLCSSAALVVNVFEYWRGRDATPLVNALGVAGPGNLHLTFEEPLPTGLAGDAPTTDVALAGADGRYIAIESKYGEWLVPRPRNKQTLKGKYFPPGERIWEAAGLPRAQVLAEDLQTGRERFKLLNAAQLLKHALGLAKNGRRSGVLVYLYYDWPAREAATHCSELDRVLARLHPEIDLRVLTYQTLFRSLRDAPGLDAAYLDYLARRYFA